MVIVRRLSLTKGWLRKRVVFGRLLFIHLQCWEVLPFLTIQRQRCIKFRVLRAQDFYTPLALNCEKGQHLPALEVYKNQSPSFGERTLVPDFVPGEHAKVPSFRFSFRSGTCERTLVPVFVPGGEHANVPSFRFSFRGEHPNVPLFRFAFRGNIRQNHPLGKPPFWVPPNVVRRR